MVCAEILAILVRQPDGIKGITIGNVKFLVSQYADDTSFILDGSQEKTKVVWVGSRKNSHIRFCENNKLQWENNEFTVLGVKFTNNLKDMVDLNYREKLTDIRKLFLNWSNRCLTPLGKITIIKGMALPKINHLILALLNPSKQIINEIQRICYEYLWNKGPDKIKQTVVVQNYQDGSLRMINVDIFIKLLKLTWLRRILLKNSMYSDYIQECFLFTKDCLQYGSLFIENGNIIVDNIFGRDIFLSLKLILKNVEPLSWNELVSTPLWYNPSIKVGGNAVFYRSWNNKCILLINDLLHSNVELLTYPEFQRKFHLLLHEGGSGLRLNDGLFVKL